jgi:serine/threonine protein kinase
MSELFQNHPDREQLTAFALGQLEEEASVVIENHLDSCGACRTATEAVADDSLVSLLRGSNESKESATTDETLAFAPIPSDVPAELAGHTRYRVKGLIGVGGMGAVFKAEHQLMERPVALKVINRDLLGNPAALERFRREVKAAARLAHPNIVTAHDADQAGDTHFLVMEYVEGISLGRLVAEKGPLPVAQACDYVRQVALGLQHAHEQGMVHRDVKPQNLMLTPQGQVKILDFGLARLALEKSPREATEAASLSAKTNGGPDRNRGGHGYARLPCPGAGRRPAQRRHPRRHL